MRLDNQTAKKFDYKWIIVSACFAMVSICLGFCSSTKVLYVDAVPAALNIPRSLFALNDSFRFATTSVINLFFGVLIAKFGPRKMIAAGFLSLVASCMVYSLATSVYVFYIGGMLLGFGISMTTTTMVGYVINIWCKEHKGTIMGLVLCANGLGGAVALQILAPIVEQDYRVSYRTSGLVVLIVGIIVVALFRNSPKGVETTHSVGKKKAKAGTWSGMTFQEALRKPYFYTAAVCVFLTGLCLQGMGSVYKAHMKDVGIAATITTNLASIHSLSLAGFKFLTGLFYDKKGLRKTMLVCDIAAIVSCLLLAFCAPTSVGLVLAFIYSVVSSIAMPLETIMLPLITADLFGEKDYAKLMGIISALNVAGYAVGSPLTNAVYDLTNSYQLIFFVFAAVLAGVTVAFMFTLNSSKREQQQQMAAQEA